MLLDSAMYSETSSSTAGLGRQLPSKLRDTYGFAIRPQHLQRYRKYASIYKEEEMERSERWECFLRIYGEENAVESSTLRAHEEDENNKSLRKLESGDTLGQDRASSFASDETQNSAGAEQKLSGNIREVHCKGSLGRDIARHAFDEIESSADADKQRNEKIREVESEDTLGQDRASSHASDEIENSADADKELNGNISEVKSEDTLGQDRTSRYALNEIQKSVDVDKQPSGIILEAQIWSELRPSLKTLGQKFGKFLKRRKQGEVVTIDSRQDQSPTLESNASTIRIHTLANSVDVQMIKDLRLEAGISYHDVSEVVGDNCKYPSRSEEASEGADASSKGTYSDNWSSEGFKRCIEKQEELSAENEELKFLVRGGVPMGLRGELWQIFVGAQACRIEGHYNRLLSECGLTGSAVIEKWTNQIEKDLPRTFPGHPALDEDGRNALRHLLSAYARQNPDVGYCQAMNFFAALLLLLMPEENAFWTLTAIINNYFEGYYSEKMLEAQVDQFVFGDLVREHFPKLISHLEALGVQVTWVSGTWFLSIFINVLPWESVLRVWDVLLLDGNRTMLFRTALALMDIHAPTLMATRDAGDAIAVLQSMAGSTFDSSQLVFTACMGFQMIDEQKLHGLRLKHRSEVIGSLQQRSLELQLWRTSQKDAKSKTSQNLFKVGAVGEILKVASGVTQLDDKAGAPINKLKAINGEVDVDGICGTNEILPLDNVLQTSLQIDMMHDDEEIDLQEKIIWLKTELCRALAEKNAAIIRAEELELALMEMVKEDNRRLLSAKLEKLEIAVAALNQEVLDKEEQERAMLQVMLRMEHEQKVTEDARRFAEEDAALQHHAASLLKEKYEKAVEELAAMERRAIMAESILEATLQYQALDNGAQNSPRQISPSIRGEESGRRAWSFGSSASG
ncbi:hypothetical protein O6H91_07G056100 [Diphasiastrum complanatum]|uniref:Uncharacterized protein n=1 Tax=Diphasiastrum complanatum TaxID=34168 RepID=A0ACC2D5C1_DIPCM|nr:hypothetical protein O6H91_07G056100 [Diphasiastrum complanatum]